MTYSKEQIEVIRRALQFRVNFLYENSPIDPKKAAEGMDEMYAIDCILDEIDREAEKDG